MKHGMRRRLATGVNAGFVTLFVVFAVLLLVDLAHQYPLRRDISADNLGTLKADTLESLASLETLGRQMEVIAFTAQQRNKEARFKNRLMKDLLRELELHSPAVTTRLVDLDRERSVAENYKVSAYGTVVVTDGSDRVDIRERDIYKRAGASNSGLPNLEFKGEALIARAMASILSGDSRRVYVLQGHGERPMAELTKIQNLMVRQGWNVKPLRILHDSEAGVSPSVPDDADVVLIMNPQSRMTPVEEEAIGLFVGGGGSVGVFLESDSTMPEFLTRLGIRISTHTIRDTPTLWPHEDWPVMRYGRHEVTEELIAANVSTVVGRASALFRDELSGVSAIPVLKTSHRAWLEMGGERPARFDEGVDERDTFDVGVLVSVAPAHPMVDKGRISRVAVFGDSNFITDEMMDHLGNPNFSMNAMRWLMGDDDRMALIGRVGTMRNVTIERATLTRIGWFVIALWPLLIVLMGAVVWRIRRGR